MTFTMATSLGHVTISTTEMHTGGEPLRIVESGYPVIQGNTILEKRRYVKEHLDHLRKFLMFEPRGHYDMYGAVLVDPDLPDAHLAVLFMHNEGYSTMCGHAVIALARYAVDKGLVKVNDKQSATCTTSVTSANRQPGVTGCKEVVVNIQCPCGLVKTYVQMKDGKSGSVRFHSVPAFAFALDVEVNVPGYGKVVTDIGYGGAFYALVPAQQVGLNVRTTSTTQLRAAGGAISDAVRAAVTLKHPDDPDLAFLYGTILTDGQDVFCDIPSANLCIFADNQVDRCPTGSGVTARVAVQYQRGLITLNQQRKFENGVNKSSFQGCPVRETRCGEFSAVIVEVTGKAYYSGTAVFTAEEEDDLPGGFLVR